jgi:twitching motility protein PilJ
MASDSRLRALRVPRFLIPLLVAVIALPIGALGLYVSQSSNDRNAAWVDLVRQIALDIRSVAKSGGDASLGVTPDFRQLAADASNFDDEVQLLRKGDPVIGLSPMPGATAAQVEAVENAWNVLKSSVASILGQQKAYESAHSSIEVIAEGVPKVSAAYERISTQQLQSQMPTGQSITLMTQIVHLEKIEGASRQVLSLGRDARNSAKALDLELRAFQANNQALMNDANLANQLKPVLADFAAIEAAVKLIVDASPAIENLQLASALLKGQATELVAAANSLEQRLDDTFKNGKILPYLSFAALGIALIALIGFGWLSYSSAIDRQKQAELRETRQQQAILNLLDEITNLANGDLTVDITVTEDFTGAIADSINYTVQTLRELVGTINATSAEIVSAAASTQGLSRQMNEASVRQAREIVATTFAATQTSQSLQEVASRAEQLSSHAQQSIAVAHNGASTVGRTIQNMAALRDQIQDTAKRIKRLGESSQEIGNITELINDIAEQTNTLALNASIQAAMAGDAGRGFAIVADEVQRLAERATSATRQIENLVRTIQADTNEAIISMERSTANVVAGAQSAEEAGQALTQIESSSHELSTLMQDISLSARSQSGEATRIAEAMQGIREIAVQTSTSAQKTATAVGELNTLSDKLRESVAGLKLP